MDFSKCSYLVSGFLFFVFSPVNADLWKEIPRLSAKGQFDQALTQENSSQPTGRQLVLNEEAMRQLLITPSREDKKLSATGLSAKVISSEQPIIQIPIPLANGETHNIKLLPDQVLPTKIARKYPDIKTFRAIPDDYFSNGRVDMGTNGFHALLQARSGETFLIDPQKTEGKQKGQQTNGEQRPYTSYKKQNQHESSQQAFSCAAKSNKDEANNEANFSRRSSSSVFAKSTDVKSLLNYRIAISATGEYVAAQGGTKAGALSAIVTTINRVNQVYEQDLGIHLTLVDNNDLLIYIDATTDPFDANTPDELIQQNQQNTDRVIGTENYDIGHLFHTKGGGLAAIASACNPYRKAQGVSGISNPNHDGFNLDFVAHEIGHQLGATHTFNGVEGLCSGATRESKTAFEPGSGSTIMSYAGYCGVDNLQSSADAMLHIGSINQIRDYTTNGIGNRCGTRKLTRNSPPSVNAGKDYAIPANTPFELSGNATDSDNDELVFSWQQVDTGERSPSDVDTGNNALFRTHMPAYSKTRSFPPLQNIAHHATSKGEVLPIRQRNLHFRFVAQDSYNAAQSDQMTIRVIRTGSRFALNLPRSYYIRGESYPVRWNTANTSQAPINCSSVNIFISTDSAYHFNKVLAKNLPNTGEAWITIPSSLNLSSEARFKLACSDNIFFVISYRDFAIIDAEDYKPTPFNDEGQAEKNLKDTDISESSPSPANNQTDTTSGHDGTTAGGANGIYSLFILWLLFFYSTKGRKIVLMGTILK